LTTETFALDASARSRELSLRVAPAAGQAIRNRFS